jgi:phytoene synthase
LAPLRDLLSAFRQDVLTTRYATFDDLLDYCRRSANPVGRLMLRLYAAESPVNCSASDSICTALQLINFWQDIAVDWQKGRVYLPSADLARFGVTEGHIAAAALRRCVAGAARLRITRARAMLESGRPLTRALPWRLGPRIVRRDRPVAIAFSTASTRRAATSSAGDPSFPAPTGRWSHATPSFLRAGIVSPTRQAPHDARRILPATYGQERDELLLQLPVPAAGAKARDHRALRVLPRSRRCRRRRHRPGARPDEARLVAARDRHRVFRRPAASVALALRPVVAAYRLPEAQFQTVIDGMTMDLERNRYVDFADLERYCHCVGGGRRLDGRGNFRLREPRYATVRARPGIAFQLTNIVRDVGEDARRGRIYLPQDELSRHGVTASMLLGHEHSAAMAPLMAEQVARARQWHQRALDALPPEDHRAQRPGLIMAAIYRALLDEIERDQYRVLDHRIALTPLRKLWIAWKTARRD